MFDNVLHIAILDRLLIDPRANLTSDLFILAVENGNVPCIRMFLRHLSVDSSSDDNRALKLAAALDAVEIIDVLLQDPRVHPTLGKRCAIGIAIEHNCYRTRGRIRPLVAVSSWGRLLVAVAKK